MDDKKRSFIAAMLYVIYFVIALPFFWIEGDSLASHPVFAAIYYWFVVAHGLLVLFAIIFEWIGHGLDSAGYRRFAGFLMIIASLAVLASAVAIVPILIVHAILVHKPRRT
jgi:hypothetical protein